MTEIRNRNNQSESKLLQWITKVADIFSKYNESSLDELGELCGSFIGFEFLPMKGRNTTVFRGMAKKTDFEEIWEERGNKTVEQISKELELDIGFVYVLASGFIKDEEDTDELIEDVNSWTEVNDVQHREGSYVQIRNYPIRLSIPKINKKGRLEKFSSTEIITFRTGMGSEAGDRIGFRPYRRIIGERNLGN
jgi:hypothetical protein